MQALELKDGTAKNDLVLRSFERGLLARPGGTRGRRLSPDLNLCAGEFAVGLEILDAALGDVR